MSRDGISHILSSTCTLGKTWNIYVGNIQLYLEHNPRAGGQLILYKRLRALASTGGIYVGMTFVITT